MKNLSIESFNAFKRKNGTDMFAVKTNMGVTFVTKEYVAKKAANIGRTVNDILSNADMYVIKSEEVILRKAGEAYEYTDKITGEVKSYTPENDFLDISNFDLTLTQDGSLNRLIAINVASQIANSISGAFSGLGQLTSQNTQSSDNSTAEPENENAGDDIVITNEQEVKA